MSAAGNEKLPRAVALRHEQDGTGAPRVVATGRGAVAAAILSAARANGVPVREDADLVELLAACDLNEEIPIELYAAVAQVLAYLYRLNQERADESSRASS